MACSSSLLATPRSQPAAFGPLELLVLQPTPFCNIDCSYCYLADRQVTRRMTTDTLADTFRWVFSSGLVREPFTLLWHAGEPLAAPLAFYERAAELLDEHNRQGVPVCQSIQTNATLLNDAWCEFFARRRVHVGVSVDGPAFLHDRCRRTRRGEGTLGRVLRGMELLRRHEIPFYALTVLTAASLDYPDELFDFYQSRGVTSVGFNVEEVEGPNVTSSLAGPEMVERFRRFLRRFVELARAADPPLLTREFDTPAAALLGSRAGPGSRTQENKPWAIVNVDCDGKFSTYSPELLGVRGPKYGDFALGNVARDRLEDVAAGAAFLRLEHDVARGVESCRQTCRHFAFCGGGAPANKYFENGDLASTETMFCRLHKQVCLEVALETLEREGVAASACAASACAASFDSAASRPERAAP